MHIFLAETEVALLPFLMRQRGCQSAYGTWSPSTGLQSALTSHTVHLSKSSIKIYIVLNVKKYKLNSVETTYIGRPHTCRFVSTNRQEITFLALYQPQLLVLLTTKAAIFVVNS